MSVLDPKTTLKNLVKKGFIETNKDHIYLDLLHDNKFVLRTKISHGSDDIRDHLIKAMAFQCGLSRSEFLDLAKCPLSKEAYFAILEKKGRLK